MKNPNNYGKIHIKLADQGKLIIVLLSIFYGYFGLFSNLVMNDAMGHQIIYTNWDSKLILWNFLLYADTFFLPPLLLLLLSFFYSITQEIPQYGIKGAIWFTSFTLFISLNWYSKIESPFTPVLSLLSDGQLGSLYQYFSIRISLIGESFLILFTSWQGFAMIGILVSLYLGGSFLGIFVKKIINIKRKKVFELESNKNTELGDFHG